jgi:hypothetical protein
MKKYFKYLLITAAGVLAAACTPEESLTDKEILDSRPVVQLEISYSVDGAALTALNFDHFARRKKVTVNVNNENLFWNLESDRSWCTVKQENHKGTGTVTLEIAANESFDPREQATITFVAGEYRKVGFTVDQDKATFLIGQPYFVSPKAGSAVNVKVTTEKETVWSYDGGDWISVAEGAQTVSDETTTTTLTLTPSANDGVSRYGSVELTSGTEKDNIWFYQFGSDLSYDDAGNVFFPSGTPATISLKAPAFMVGSVDVPDYATGTITEEGDENTVITIEMEENLSDCGEERTLEASLKLSNASATIVSLPAIVQDYTPANGIVTAKGLQAFAKAVAEGESTATWERDGAVTVIKDIDMNGIAGWTGIGTAAHPFTGRFDGGKHSVTNLKNTAYGLFNYCKDATVQDITLGKGCSIYNNRDYAAKGGFGGVVSVAENTTVSGCGMTGSLEFSGTSDDDYPAYIGGVVGWADTTSTIKGVSMNGTLTVAPPAADDIVCYVGGIAGLCEGSLSSSEVLGQIIFSSSVGTGVIGGIQGALTRKATVSNNGFTGTVTLGGACKNPVVGGLYGRIDSDHSFDNASDKSVSLGTININSFFNNASTCVYVGGFAGLAAKDIKLSFKGYEAQSNIIVDEASAAMTAAYICIGGFLGGNAPDGPAASLEFEELTSSGNIETQVATAITCSIRRQWIGGIAGYANGLATFKGCINKGEVGKSTAVYCARSNQYGAIIGGIAGYAGGGNAVFEKCSNQGEISNHHYNNNGTTATQPILGKTMYTPCIAAGVLGAFNYGSTVEKFTLTMSECSNAKSIFSYRGYTGGIVGYCYNATITSCTNSGRQANGTNDQSAYRGGIAGAAGNATIKNCTASGDITSLVYGSADYACAGGILGFAKGDEPVVIDNCSYSGIIKADKMSSNPPKPEYPGGIIGMGTESSIVRDCKFGGTVQGVVINENNVSEKVSGNGVGTVEGTITYWPGSNS